MYRVCAFSSCYYWSQSFPFCEKGPFAYNHMILTCGVSFIDNFCLAALVIYGCLFVLHDIYGFTLCVWCKQNSLFGVCVCC